MAVSPCMYSCQEDCVTAPSVLQVLSNDRIANFVQSLDHPELVVSWGSEFPDKLKLRKQVTLWPLRFKLRADYNRAARNFEYGCSCKVSMALLEGYTGARFEVCTVQALRLCWSLMHVQCLRTAGTNSTASVQDAILGGRFRVDANSHEIEYRCALQPKLHCTASTVSSGYYICLTSSCSSRRKPLWISLLTSGVTCRKRLRLGNGQIGATVKGSYAGDSLYISKAFFHSAQRVVIELASFAEGVHCCCHYCDFCTSAAASGHGIP